MHGTTVKMALIVYRLELSSGKPWKKRNVCKS